MRTGDWLRGRAHPSHGWGRRFKSCIAHHLHAKARLDDSLAFFVCGWRTAVPGARCARPGWQGFAFTRDACGLGGKNLRLCTLHAAGVARIRVCVRHTRSGWQGSQVVRGALVHNLRFLPAGWPAPCITSRPCQLQRAPRAQPQNLASRSAHVMHSLQSLSGAGSLRMLRVRHSRESPRPRSCCVPSSRHECGDIMNSIFAVVPLCAFPYSSFSRELTGGIAQLGERLTGSQEVRGSNPLISTR